LTTSESRLIFNFLPLPFSALIFSAQHTFATPNYNRMSFDSGQGQVNSGKV
jgi:hypothetical protein